MINQSNQVSPANTYPALSAAGTQPTNVNPVPYPSVPPVYGVQSGPTYKPSNLGMMMPHGKMMPYGQMMPHGQMMPYGQMMPPMGSGMGTPPMTGGQQAFEESYIENILRLNLGKMATLYMTYENNSQWNAKIFKGRIEAAGRDHIIISDLQTGMRYLLLMVNLDYITFDEPLNYSYPGVGTVSSGAGR